MANSNRYTKIIEKIFLSKYKKGAREVPFDRTDIERMAAQLGITLPKNLGDLIYSFRYRTPLPDSVQERAPKGEGWIIRPAGKGKYCFVATSVAEIEPRKNMAKTKVPDATPGLISMYALNDEQALLAKLRYNRLVDIFTQVTCYPLQSHLRTAVPSIGQIETDEVYIGVDRRGAQYVFPVQAKGKTDQINIVQIEQDVAMCKQKFPRLLCRPIATQFMKNDVIVLFEFEENDEGFSVSLEKHYRLVPPDEISSDDLAKYRERSFDQKNGC